MAETNSLNLRLSRYTAGGITETANNRLEWWSPNRITEDDSDTFFTVTRLYEGKLNAISYASFGDSRYWWVIAMLNNIVDPLNEVIIDTVLRIPSKERLDLYLASNQGGIDSLRQPISTILPIAS